jgi:preprotein translocase subunit SecF
MQIFPLRFVSDNTKIAFMKLRYFSFILSIVLSILSIILLFTNSLNFGIDFTGGVVIEARSNTEPDIAKMRHVLNGLELGDISLQTFGKENDFMIRIGGAHTQADVSVILDKIKNSFKAEIKGEIEYRKTDFVGPQVGGQLIASGVQALVLAFFAIMVYIWFRFEWQFGVGVLIALVHDLILSIGFLSITQLDFNLSSIAALLTIIGYSVNDSVVIYDRIRENLKKHKNKTVDEIIDISINETLSRTTMTVVTTLIANLALIIWGGEAIRSFSVLVFFGIIAGTYSSIFISAPILKILGLEKLK